MKKDRSTKLSTVELVDSEICCRNGCPKHSGKAYGKQRRVKVQTLKDGVFNAYVRDCNCMHCGMEVRFDGYELEIFCASKRWIMCRDVLDVLLYNVACPGQAFRRSYESLRNILETMQGSTTSE